jgi:hypothetical protein
VVVISPRPLPLRIFSARRAQFRAHLAREARGIPDPLGLRSRLSNSQDRKDQRRAFPRPKRSDQVPMQ